MNNLIINNGKEVSSIQGPEAMDAFRIRMLISGIKFEKDTGMRMSRGVNCKKLAKQMTGLKTNDIAKLTERLELMLEQRLSQCVIVNEGEQS